MKKVFKNISLVALLLIGTTSIAQKEFEGHIVFSQDYELPESMEAQRSMLPTEMHMYIGDNHTKIVQSTMFGDQIVIAEHESKMSTLLMDMMGQKMAIEMDASKMEEEEKVPEPEYTYHDETKTVAGYLCHRATMTVEDENGEETESEIYYTKEIPASANDKHKGLDGFPLEYTINSNGMTVEMVATKVEKSKISKKEFEIPDGYKKMTMDEFQSMMGQ